MLIACAKNLDETTNEIMHYAATNLGRLSNKPFDFGSTYCPLFIFSIYGHDRRCRVNHYRSIYSQLQYSLTVSLLFPTQVKAIELAECICESMMAKTVMKNMLSIRTRALRRQAREQQQKSSADTTADNLSQLIS